MSPFDYEVLVIGGGGSAGFTAASAALKSGSRVAVVEGGRMGGLCILEGCMPSKAYLWSAARELAAGRGRRSEHRRIHERKNSVVDFLAGGREKAVAAKEKQGLKVLRGKAVFYDRHTVEVDGRPVRAANIVVATGSVEAVPTLPGLAEVGYICAKQFLALPELPARLAVLGGGAVALELAQYAGRMGSQVTLIQRSANLLSAQPPEVGELIASCLSREGIAVRTGTALERVAAAGESKMVRYRHQGQAREVEVDQILLALGRRPNTDGLNLAAAGIDFSPGAIAVDRYLRTSQPHIYAAGDVTGVNMVVNLAILQGQVAGYNASHQPGRPIDDRVVPRAIFCDPQFARVGLSRDAAREQGLDFAEVKYDLADVGVTYTYPEPPQGFMIMRAERSSGRLLGGEIVAPEASLLIHDLTVALSLKATAKQLADIPYVHPCLSELTNYCAHRLAGKLED